MSEFIYFYHTNDLHSHFSHWPKIQMFLYERQLLHNEAAEDCFTLDIGDFIDRSHPFTDATAGKGNSQLLLETNYDFITIGNNEGITLSKEELEQLYPKDMTVLVANLEAKQGEAPTWLHTSAIRVTKKGTKIGFIGVTAPYPLFYEVLGWKISDPLEALSNEMKKLRKEVDIIVVLSHLGIHQDEVIAERFPAVDIIFGAHTHHILHYGKEVGNSLLAAGGKFGQYVGMVELEINDAKNIVNRNAVLYDTNELDTIEDGPSLEEKLVEEGKRLLSKPVLETSEWRNLSKKGMKDFYPLFGDALMEYCNADCAMFPTGIFLQKFPETVATKWDFHQMLPHPINACKITLSQQSFLELYHQANANEFEMVEVKGLGFRGKLLGKMIFRHVEVKNDCIYLQGKVVEKHDTIELATLDMFTFGYFFPQLATAKIEYFLPLFLRDIFRYYLQGKFEQE
ncbi:bifunctional metallophosphatase/5'-nucleotidase [Paenisporosarcina cavernae]|uniref:Bifunctional metallophosphatase/5'-nucleotidase n=1 Tax=Paenisporosarcina cavernae TaxID=2320858 RepID=A0A385YVQ9_9BACL|nr:metallophosphatase [Paenisporosarcina cavernae]AYC29977.1 bifunctional metallophosphatase/5'-nucleotidase [Paenisporosarcina cavernae]